MAKDAAVVRQVKKLHWHSTFGEIVIVEQTYIGKRDGKLHRPFATVAEVRCRSCSLPLQRVITDFGADSAFGQVGAKLKEHYGITVPLGAAATLTERHARALSDDDVTPPATTAITPLTLIVEADGSMIPVVQIGEGTPQVRDKRKHRTLSWKEARLSLVRRPDEVEPTFVVGRARSAAGQGLGDSPALVRASARADLQPGSPSRSSDAESGWNGRSWLSRSLCRQIGLVFALLSVFAPATRLAPGPGSRDEEKNVYSMTIASMAALSCAAAIAFAMPPAANAAAPVVPVAPPAPPKPPPPGSNPYQPVVQNDVTSAYQFRTRILVSPPSCERFAAQADQIFFNGTIADETKTELLHRVALETAAAGCLGRM